MTDKQQELWDLLCSMNTEIALGFLTEWHGLQLLDYGFYEFMVDEGYIDGPPEEDNADQEAHERYAAFLDFCGDYETCEECPLNKLSGNIDDCMEFWCMLPKLRREGLI